MQGPLSDVSNSLSHRQLVYVRYLTFVLIDLLVLNLFQEYWAYVTIDSFTISLLAAILLQFMLKVTIFLEHLAADFFKSKSGFIGKLRIVSAWAILFVSKLVILGAINFLFGDEVLFSGPYHGLLRLLLSSPPCWQLNRWF